MGGLRVRVSANQPAPETIRQDFSRDADHLWGTGAFLLRHDHYVHVTTGGRRRRRQHGTPSSGSPRARSAEPQLLRTPEPSSPGLSLSAVFEYDSPGATSVLAPKRGPPPPPQQLPPLDDAVAARGVTRPGAGGSAQAVMQNLDRYLDNWAGSGQPLTRSPSPSFAHRRRPPPSPTRRTATDAGAELALDLGPASRAESRAWMARQLSPSRMRDRQTSAAYGAGSRMRR